MSKEIETYNEEEKLVTNIDGLFGKISAIIEESRGYVATAVKLAEVYSKYQIGMYIVEEEQQGKQRAQYGKQVLKELATRLTEAYGDGWSVEQLTLIRKFYMTYSKIVNTDYEIQDSDLASSLYERLALSRDKNEVMRLSREGMTIETPKDVLKNPISLEFLGLKPEAAYTEDKLEGKIISKLGQFLLEMGKGFLFEARQKRFVFDEESSYLDLVCYNRLLQCYVLIDLKMDKLTHQDLGQMMMYVNYYDRYVKQDFEKPTIGILLCKSKRDALVELTLPKDANIYAEEYALYLPDKKELQAKLQEWMDEFDDDTK